MFISDRKGILSFNSTALTVRIEYIVLWYSLSTTERVRESGIGFISCDVLHKTSKVLSDFLYSGTTMLLIILIKIFFFFCGAHLLQVVNFAYECFKKIFCVLFTLNLSVIIRYQLKCNFSILLELMND